MIHLTAYAAAIGRAVDGSQKHGLVWRIQHFLGELKRRKVFHVTSVYLIAAWGLSAGAADIFEVLDFPNWASRYFVIALFSFTPVVIVIAWVFELSKSGIQRDTGPEAAKVSTVDQTTVLAFQGSIPVLSTNWLGKKQRFANDFIAGRDDTCGLQLVSPMISRQHAKFEFSEGRWRVRDLGSSNGILVDGQRVDSAALERETYVQFYPGGPELQISIAGSVSTETQIA